MKPALLSALGIALLLSSCEVAPYGAPGVTTVGVDVGYYDSLPPTWDRPYYAYNNRYYYGGAWQTGRYYHNGRYYDGRYSHHGQYIYGGHYNDRPHSSHGSYSTGRSYSGGRSYSDGRSNSDGRPNSRYENRRY